VLIATGRLGAMLIGAIILFFIVLAVQYERGEAVY